MHVFDGVSVDDIVDPDDRPTDVWHVDELRNLGCAPAGVLLLRKLSSRWVRVARRTCDRIPRLARDEVHHLVVLARFQDECVNRRSRHRGGITVDMSEFHFPKNEYQLWRAMASIKMRLRTLEQASRVVRT